MEDQHRRGEAELVIAAQHGDSSAFDELVRRNREPLVSYCQSRLGGDCHAAEEVVQETLFKAHQSLPTLGGEMRFAAWIRVIAGRRCIDYLRRHGRERPAGTALNEAAHSCDDPAEWIVSRHHAQDVIGTAIAQVSHRHREVLQMSIVEGLTRREIAARTDTPISTIEPLLSRARASLRRNLTQLGAALGGISLTIRRLKNPVSVPAAAIATAAASALTAAIIATGTAPPANAGAEATTAETSINREAAGWADSAGVATGDDDAADSRLQTDRFGAQGDADTSPGPEPQVLLETPAGDVTTSPSPDPVTQQQFQVWIAGEGIGIDLRGRLPHETPRPIREWVDSQRLVVGDPPE